MSKIALMLVALAIPVSPTSAADGRAAYLARCARCHGDTGRGDGEAARALKVAPLVEHREVARMTPDEIVAMVKADTKHRGVVDLDDADLAAAAVYVRDLAGKTALEPPPR